MRRSWPLSRKRNELVGWGGRGKCRRVPGEFFSSIEVYFYIKDYLIKKSHLAPNNNDSKFPSPLSRTRTTPSEKREHMEAFTHRQAPAVSAGSTKQP